MTDLIAQTWPIWLWILPALIVFEIARQALERDPQKGLQEKVDDAQQFFCESVWPVMYAVAALLGPVCVAWFMWTFAKAIYRKVVGE